MLSLGQLFLVLASAAAQHGSVAPVLLQRQQSLLLGFEICPGSKNIAGMRITRMTRTSPHFTTWSMICEATSPRHDTLIHEVLEREVSDR